MLNKNMAPSSAKAKDGRFNFCDNSKIQTHQKKEYYKNLILIFIYGEISKKKNLFWQQIKNGSGKTKFNFKL